jgi:toxin HigB-1
VNKIVWDSGFKKSYLKRIKYNEDRKKKFWKNMELFSKDPFHRSLRTHKLTGRLEGLWAFSVDYDTRVVFSFTNDKDDVLLIDFGGHDEVY